LAGDAALAFGPASSFVTRIDWPTAAAAAARAVMVAPATLASQLASKSCRVELHGIYFNSGSAGCWKSPSRC
jgi:hypothetical protein